MSRPPLRLVHSAKVQAELSAARRAYEAGGRVSPSDLDSQGQAEWETAARNYVAQMRLAADAQRPGRANDLQHQVDVIQAARFRTLSGIRDRCAARRSQRPRLDPTNPNPQTHETPQVLPAKEAHCGVRGRNEP